METVLIVDDSEFIRMNIKKIVEQIGHEVVGMASNGADALKMYMELHPSVVTLDIIMPKMNGLQALQKLVEINPDVKVLIATAMAHQPVIKKALKLGALGFVTKPFTTSEFIESFNAIL